MVAFPFSTYDICYVLMILELRMVVVYTDYYMYFEEHGMAGRFGTGVCICMLLWLHRSAPWHYICRVAGCPSNRRVMSDFLEKSKDILNNKNKFQEINWIKLKLIYLFIYASGTILIILN